MLREDYKIAHSLSMKYPITLLLRNMGLNRSGYYKWLHRKDEINRYLRCRMKLIPYIKTIHQKHKTYGYHRVATLLRRQVDDHFSDLLIHKCMKSLKIKSIIRHYRYHSRGDEHTIFKNEVSGQWNATKPYEIVVSDMTQIRNHSKTYELTLFVDTFNNEIIAQSLSSRIGDTKPYYDCLFQYLGKIKGIDYPSILHTDQGTVYSSKAFNQALLNYNTIHSMSRAATPTDNPIMEAINGWMKDELYRDYHLYHSDNVIETIHSYIHHFNHERPAFALNYKTPIQYKHDLGF